MVQSVDDKACVFKVFVYAHESIKNNSHCTWGWQLYGHAVISVSISAAVAATAYLPVFILGGCLLLQKRSDAKRRMVHQRVPLGPPIVPQVQYLGIERGAPMLWPENNP
jgi:hypothetical protein